jgi:hypothetical protein
MDPPDSSAIRPRSDRKATIPRPRTESGNDRGRDPRSSEARLTYWRLTESVNVAVIEGWPPVSV